MDGAADFEAKERDDLIVLDHATVADTQARDSEVCCYWHVEGCVQIVVFTSRKIFHNVHRAAEEYGPNIGIPLVTDGTALYSYYHSR